MPFTSRQGPLRSEARELAMSYTLLHADYVLDSVLTQVTLGTLKAVFEHKRPKEKEKESQDKSFIKLLAFTNFPLSLSPRFTHPGEYPQLESSKDLEYTFVVFRRGRRQGVRASAPCNFNVSLPQIPSWLLFHIYKKVQFSSKFLHLSRRIFLSALYALL